MKKLLLFSLVILQSFLNAQQNNGDHLNDALEAYEAKLDSIDKKTIDTKYLLNKGFLSQDLLSDYFDFKGSGEDGLTISKLKSFKKIYRGLRQSDLKNSRRLPRPRFKEIKQQYLQLDNTIPLGIVQAKGEYLDSLEIEKNLRKLRNGIENDDNYTKYNVFIAAALKKKVFSGDVHFEVLPQLFNIQNPNRVESVSIDFYDGNGYRAIDANSTFDIAYDSPGEKIIAVKFQLKNRAFIAYSMFEVVTIDDEEPDFIISSDGQTVNGKAELNREKLNSSRSGAPISQVYGEVYGGCDQVFDRPVIVIEGFDALNERFQSTLRRNYTDSQIEQIFRANGYDMVYVNLRDGGRDILENAGFMEDFIQTINNLKVGNDDIVLIGESMGGLVGRIAIRNLELSNITHNISHYISFDTPHKGANAPIGFQKMLIDAEENWPRQVFGLGTEEIEEALEYFRSEAARQLLIINDGTTPHPDFNVLQSELNRLGFPRQGGIQNIALTNGALDASVGEPGLIPNDGNKILDGSGWFGIAGIDFQVWSNQIGTNDVVSDLVFTGLGIGSMKSRHNSNRNYDIIPGGFEDMDVYTNQLPSEISVDVDHNRFCFIPLHSSLASEGPVNTQGQLSRSEANMDNNNWIPFDEVYGNPTVNTRHIDAVGISSPFYNMMQLELGVTLTTNTCTETPTPQTPPTPNFNTNYYWTCQYGTDRTLSVTNGSEADDTNLYRHTWRVTGPRSLTLTGDMLIMNSNWPPGVYSVKLERSFANGLGTRKSVRTKGFTIFSQNNSQYCGGGSSGTNPRPGGGNKLVADINSYPDESTGSSLIWPNPTRNTLGLNYQLTINSAVGIELHSLNGSRALKLFSGSQKEGNHTHAFDVSTLPNGIYILTLNINGKIETKKIIIE